MCVVVMLGYAHQGGLGDLKAKRKDANSVLELIGVMGGINRNCD